MKNKPKKPIKRIKQKFADLRLNQKIEVGYVFIVFLPVVLLTAVMLYFSSQDARRSFQQSQEQELSTVNIQLSSELQQISNYTFYFQKDAAIVAYLNSEYKTVSDVMYHWFDHMEYVFESPSNNKLISSVTVYGYNDNKLKVNGCLESMEDFDGTQELQRQISRSPKGIWNIDGEGSCSYYKAIYNSNYSKMLGIIRIDADLKGIFNTVTATLNSSWYLLDEGQNLLLRFSGTSFEHCGNEEASAVLSSPGLISTENEDLGCRLIKPLNLHSIYSFHIWLYLIVGFGLLGLFSIVYFLILNSLVRRLVDFTSFLSGQNARELIPYHTEPSRDEIGSVIENYNSLISRINELIHNNYEVSIKAKDAMYYALQAQIEPHFIYNILENIRMSSEQHNDQETAHIIAAFGSYLRYTLNASSEPDYLETSLLNAKNYLEINKMRLDPYLSYDISIQTEPDRLYCPRFVIQTLLENAIEHGYEKNKPMHISVSVTGCDDSELSDEVRVTVTDDGRGINKDYLAVILQILSDSSTRPPTRHVGLRNVNDRLKAFNPDHSGLSIRPHAPRGTEISFQLWRKAADENTDRRR